MKKQKEINEKTAALEEKMEEKLRLETMVEEWKDDFVGVNGREPTTDEKPAEIRELSNQIKLVKNEIKRMNAEIFRISNN